MSSGGGFAIRQEADTWYPPRAIIDLSCLRETYPIADNQRRGKGELRRRGRVARSGSSRGAASRTLGLVEQTLFNWVKAHHEGKLKGAASRVEGDR